jgi:hypothetical protein
MNTTLIDSVYINNHYCYRIDFFPKSPQDLAFTGAMWITKNEYALSRLMQVLVDRRTLTLSRKLKYSRSLNQPVKVHGSR